MLASSESANVGSPEKDPFAIALGQRIRAAREAAGMTQDALAKRVAYHPIQLSKVENGKSMPGADVLFRISEATGVAVGDLYATALGQPPPAEEPAVPSRPGTLPGSDRASGLSPEDRRLLAQAIDDAAEAKQIAESVQSDIEASKPALEAALQTLGKIEPALVERGILPAPQTRRKRPG